MILLEIIFLCSCTHNFFVRPSQHSVVLRQWSFLILQIFAYIMKCPYTLHASIIKIYATTFSLKQYFGEKAVAEGKNCMQKVVKSSIVNLTSFIFSMESFDPLKVKRMGEPKYVFMFHVTVMFRMALARTLVFEVFSGTANN